MTKNQGIYALCVFMLLLGIISVFYFSWIDSPRLSFNNLVPDWIAKWADKQENENLRTAVPFVFLGFFSGTFIIINKYHKKWWLRTVIFLTVVVFLAELGQFFLPLRMFDWLDIIWGVIGISAGLGLPYIFYRIKNG